MAFFNQKSYLTNLTNSYDKVTALVGTKKQ